MICFSSHFPIGSWSQTSYNVKAIAKATDIPSQLLHTFPSASPKIIWQSASQSIQVIALFWTSLATIDFLSPLSENHTRCNTLQMSQICQTTWFTSQFRSCRQRLCCHFEPQQAWRHQVRRPRLSPSSCFCQTVNTNQSIKHCLDWASTSNRPCYLWITRLGWEFVTFLALFVKQVNHTISRANAKLLVIGRPGHRWNLGLTSLEKCSSLAFELNVWFYLLSHFNITWLLRRDLILLICILTCARLLSSL